MNWPRRAALAIALMVPAGIAHADGIEAGLWKITVWIEQRGLISPPHASAKCLTADDTRDLLKTFGPVSRTINSECRPLEHTLTDTHLSWKLICRGQLNLDVTGDFVFADTQHYVATIQNKATMGGLPMADTRTMIEAERVSECQ